MRFVGTTAGLRSRSGFKAATLAAYAVLDEPSTLEALAVAVELGVFTPAGGRISR